MKIGVFTLATCLIFFAPEPALATQLDALSRCVTRVDEVLKTLRALPGIVTRDYTKRTCVAFHAFSVRSSGSVVRYYVDAANVRSKIAPAEVVAACPGLVRQAVFASGADAKAKLALSENIESVCTRAQGRPTLAAVVVFAGLAKADRCISEAMASLRVLGVGPKFNNQQYVGGFCHSVRNQSMIAVRDLLIKITIGAK